MSTLIALRLVIAFMVAYALFTNLVELREVFNVQRWLLAAKLNGSKLQSSRNMIRNAKNRLAMTAFWSVIVINMFASPPLRQDQTKNAIAGRLSIVCLLVITVLDSRGARNGRIEMVRILEAEIAEENDRQPLGAA